MYKKKTRKLLSFLLTLALLIPLCQGIMPERVAEAATVLHNPRMDSEGVTTWDKVKFGSYYQTAKFKPEPIKWRVLSVNGDDAFLLADECLDCKPYNTKEEDVTWETCSLRKWLNEDFYNKAFDSSEQTAIIKTTVVNKDNPQYGTVGGKNTADCIYLLSEDEVCNADYGFALDSARESKNTDYAKCNHAYTYINEYSKGDGTAEWWLRSPGDDSSRAKCVDDSYIDPEGDYVYYNRAVRPVLHLNLSSSVHTDAGEVDSEGNVTNKADGISAPKKDSNGITTWDCVYLGNYKQTAEWKKEPIEWRVLSVNGDDAFLLADKCLDGKPYNTKDEDVTWETCSLRKWLNEDFYNEAFNSSEREAIMKTAVVTGANPEYGTAGGNDTMDRIYLLSIDEVYNADYGFAPGIYGFEETRQAKNTDYAECNNAHIWNSGEGTGIWWLRSPGDFYSNVSYVEDNGYVHKQGDGVDFYNAVRPALHLNLSSTSSWSYAGTVNSEGEVDETGVTKPTEPGSTEKPSVPPTATPGEVTGKLKNPTTDANGVVTWDCVYFGNYWQDDTNGDGKADQNDAKKPIKWRVLSVNGDDAFLVADKNLDCQKYNDTRTSVTWETCTMRSWLNGYSEGENEDGKDYGSNNFFNNAFSKSEQSAIKTTRVVNDDNPEYGTEGGNNTSDKVYLLSINEVMNPDYGFSSDYSKYDESRRAKNTEYAKAQRAHTDTSEEYAGNSYWRLRSPGYSSNDATGVFVNGGVDRYGYLVIIDPMAVRPALHLNLSSLSSWSYAGTVNSDGKVDEAGATKPTETPGEVTGKLKNPTTNADGVVTWDCIWFGNYWQEDTNGDGKADKDDAKQPIKWRVLAVDDDDAFLVADKNLDCRKYNDTDTDVTWETCTMRTWLNGYEGKANKDGKSYGRNNFLRNAFSKSEQLAIKTTDVVNNDNPEKNTAGGNNTLDKVYLLSLDEATNPAYGFSSDYSESDKSRWAKTTEYAKAQGVETYSELSDTYAGNGYWWLRSPGIRSSYACEVYGHGSVDRYGNYVNDGSRAARPALHLNLKASSGTISSSSWSYAGTVTSKGKVEEIEATKPIEPGIPSTPPTVTPGEFTGKLNNPTTDADGIVTWDCVYFGNYWREDTNGDGKADKNDEKTPIKWRVLSVEGDDVLLLADENLDCQKYNETHSHVTWETCTMRSWLNGYGAEVNQDGKDYGDDSFLINAFSKTEQSAIKVTNVVNNDNPKYATKGGNNTSDKLYLLSIKEVMNPTYGFLSDSSVDDQGKRGKTTGYAKAQGVKTYSVISDIYAKYGYWWLRSPGRYSNFGSTVDDYGSVNVDGEFVHNSSNAVRPALHLNLSSTSSWSYAGTVNSEGKVKETGATKPIESEKPSTPPTATPEAISETTPTPKPPTSVPPTVTPGEFTGKLNNPTTDADGIVTWDCVYFGNYWQEDTNGDGKADKNDAKQPIKWRVLSVDGDDAFLVADKNLDCQSYNDTFTEVTWETCTMRSWLNGYGADVNQEGKDYSDNNFLDNAFSKSEQSVIRRTSVVNDGNREFEVGGGKDTIDKVYLLSIDEVTNLAYGFASSINRTKTREAVNTSYVAGGGEVKASDMESAGSTDAWWLRSPGDLNLYAAYGGEAGYGGLYGVCVQLYCTVRPALHLNLSSRSNWSYAGTVTSEGGEVGTATPTLRPTSSPQPEVTEEPDDIPAEKPSAKPTVPAGTDKPGNTSIKNPLVTSEGVTTWDCIWFGNYWQEDTNGDREADKNDDKTPIKWRVLSVNGDDAFLVADKNLDCQRYNETDTSVTWETCTMRSWLNGYGAEKNESGKDYGSSNFLCNAFSEAEQSAIKITNVVNDDNFEYGTKGGNNTSDKVYLLSIDEVTNPDYGFSASNSWEGEASRKVLSTAYAKRQGGWMDEEEEYVGNDAWWLRSPGYVSSMASCVYDYGFVYKYGYGVHSSNSDVRPALHLNLSSISSWSYAGTVTSEGKVEEIEATKPIEPESTDKPSVTPTAPGTSSQPGNSSVIPSISQPVSPVSPSLGILSNPGKGTIGKVSALKLKQKKNTVIASWKKLTGVKGYQICYGTSKKWKGKKQKLVTKNNVVIKNLKKKKTYYFRIRAYRMEGTKKVYGAWSSVKKINIKK